MRNVALALLLAPSAGEQLSAHNQVTLLGSYPHLLKNSLTNLSSLDDIAASVAEAIHTKQTLMGSYIDECFYYDSLRPMLTATHGTGISVFGMLRSHNGNIYCPAIWGNGSVSPASGQEVNWTHVATSLATLSLEFPHFVGFTIDDFYSMMANPLNPPRKAANSAPPLSVAAMAQAHTAMRAVSKAFKFMPTVYPGYLGVYAGAGGYVLGVGAALPFDVNTSASLSLIPAAAARGPSEGGSLSFWLSSTFATYDRNGGALRARRAATAAAEQRHPA